MRAKTVWYGVGACVFLSLLIFHFSACEGVPDPGNISNPSCGGCGGGGGGGTAPSPFDFPGVAGTVTFADDRTPVSGAHVILSPYPGGSLSVMSGDAGLFRFDFVRDGKYTVAAEKGHLSAEVGISVVNGKTTGVLTMALDAPGAFAVVAGDHDQVGVLIFNLGYEYTILSDEALADYENIRPHKLLFLCSESISTWANNRKIQDNLKKFVSEGGHLFVSDRDYLYVKKCWPNAITFRGPTPMIGVGQTLTAEVTDKAGRPNLAGYLGKETADLNFDRAGWVIIDKVDPGTTVLLRGNPETTAGRLSNKPLLVYFRRGEGIVVYSSFVCNNATPEDARRTWEYVISLNGEV